MTRKSHWNAIYSTKGEQDVSWFEAFPAVSLDMLASAGLTADSCVLDVGGGDSRLVDTLAARGLTCLAVLDVSGAALQRARHRVNSPYVIWLNTDVTGEWELKPMDIWHDRAVFHFLVEPWDRTQYRAHLDATLKPGGAAILATFALDGPQTCSGLPVMRYSPESLAAELGDGFRLEEWRPHSHRTPWGTTQSFQYSRFRKM